MAARRSLRGWSPPSFRPVAFLTGGLLVAVGLAMLVPAAVDALAGNPDWKGFLASSAGTALFGGVVMTAARCRLSEGLTLRQAFLLTPLAWTAVSAFGAVPFYFSTCAGLRGDVANAFFEAVSGLTTTGATVVVGLDAAPPGVLLWRAILQWLGGIGIIGVAIAVLPALGVGGMQLFRTESSDRSEKVLPRARQIATAISFVYVGLTLLCVLAYWAAGMHLFDAVAHALTTISTSGYSTHDASMAFWDEAAIHWVATSFMILGALPFVLYVRVLHGEPGSLWRSSQVRTFIGFLAAVILLVAVWLAASGAYGFGDALRHAAFNVVSVVTTTGFATTDYSLWGNTAIGLFFGLMFVGGCTGSTAGGIKIFRFELMARMLRAHFLHLVFPKGLFPRVYNNRLLGDDVVNAVVVFFALFFISYSAITIALMAMDLDFLTSASAAVTALSNVGPGLGEIIGPAGNFSTLPDGAKWLLSFSMVLGRLEIFTVLVLFAPQFWRG
jgi:trk system potassium uptake protein